MNQQVTQRTTCRVCGSNNLTHLFSFGEQFVSDFVDEANISTGIKVSITLQLCGQCTLVQQEYTAPQEILYSRHYWYKSGTTDTMRRALANVVDAAMDQVQLQPGDVVLDIGSNDGTLLRQYPKELGLVTIGVEPATNMKEEGSRGIDCLINDFWDANTFLETKTAACWNREVPSAHPTVITAIGMFYDLEDPNKFIADIRRVLAKDGIFVAQLMCLKQTVQMKDVGNFAHEHLEFYSLASLIHLFAKHGLTIVDVEENDVNGGSYRIFAKHTEAVVVGPFNAGMQRVQGYLEYEYVMGLADPDMYKEWFNDVALNAHKLTTLLQRIRSNGESVYVYGASTKGNVILQFCGINNDIVLTACDKDSTKWGKYTVGTGIEIVNENVMRSSRASYLLILPYAFVYEFVNRESDFLERGGKFIVPLPKVHIIRTNIGGMVPAVIVEEVK